MWPTANGGQGEKKGCCRRFTTEQGMRLRGWIWRNGGKVGQGCRDEHSMSSALKGFRDDRCGGAGLQRTVNYSLPSKSSAP